MAVGCAGQQAYQIENYVFSENVSFDFEPFVVGLYVSRKLVIYRP